MSITGKALAALDDRTRRNQESDEATKRVTRLALLEKRENAWQEGIEALRELLGVDGCIADAFDEDENLYYQGGGRWMFEVEEGLWLLYVEAVGNGPAANRVPARFQVVDFCPECGTPCSRSPQIRSLADLGFALKQETNSNLNYHKSSNACTGVVRRSMPFPTSHDVSVEVGALESA